MTFGSVLSTPVRLTPGPELGAAILIVPEFGSSGNGVDETLSPSVRDDDSSKLFTTSSSRHGIVVVVVDVGFVGSPGQPDAGAGTRSLMCASWTERSARSMIKREYFPPPRAWQIAAFPRGNVVVVDTGSDWRSTRDGHPSSGAGMMSPSWSPCPFRPFRSIVIST